MTFRSKLWHVRFSTLPDFSPLSISITQGKGKRFTVTYGQQIAAGLSYAEACAKLGQAIMHALACEGGIDNEGP